MKKKIITTTILALGLLQGASIAHAETFSHRMGGVGHGNIFTLDQSFSEAGSMVVKLNGILTKTDELGNDTYIGDAFVTAVVLDLNNPIADTFPFECTVTPADGTHHQIMLECKYPTDPEFSSDGQCYITKDDHDRVMACNFLYDIPLGVFGTELPLFVPMSFDIIR